MVDTIDRAKTIKAIYENCICINECEGSAEKCEQCDSFVVSYADVIGIIKEQPTATAVKMTSTGNNNTFVAHVDKMIL